ncbi:MAG: ATP-dependent helicase [Treponema sp.]|jgi:DNA helicase-2/ATP-dependent DNA helicase PcrA|nr:ATP-dependent helicase [Treponema sp.]
MELPSYLAVLNEEQRQAVLHMGTPLLILAGAGSGKTRVITTKIAYLIREHGFDPRSILAVTFTNKAAVEMAERARLIEPRAQYAILRTFHSFGAWFLRRNAELAGLSNNFIIYDEEDMANLIASLPEAKNKQKADIKIFARQIARAKDSFLRPEDAGLSRINYRKDFKKIYQAYENRLLEIGNVDFGDLINKPIEILRNNPSLAEDYRDRFRVIMVDEYQDTNIAQFTLLKELSGDETYVCVVGDDDQSIYRFRGAEVRNILEFPDRFSGTDIIRLEKNYRSTTPILKVASSVVSNNKGRLGKTLFAERGNGKLPVLAFLPNQDEEAVFTAQIIGSSVDSPAVKKGETFGESASYSDWAVLYRTNAQSLGFETEFLRRRIPYRVVGSLKFYDREEVKDSLALLSVMVNPRDIIAFRRVVNKPSRGVGAVSIDKIIDSAFDGDLLSAARRIAPDLPGKARKGVESFLKAIEAGCAALNGDNPMEFLSKEALVDESDITAEIRKEQKRRAIKEKAKMANHGGEPSIDNNGRLHAPIGGYKFFSQDWQGDLDAPFETIYKGGQYLPDPENLFIKNDDKQKSWVAAHTDDPRSTPDVCTLEETANGKIEERFRAGQGLSRCVVTLVKAAGIADYHLSHDEIAGEQRIANLQELANAASLYPATKVGLLEFLEHIELDRSMEEKNREDANAVTLITLHNTKGLEFRRVIMTGVEQGVFPRDDKKSEDLEEERRLFYVGATRAMDELYFTSCAVRRIFGQTRPMEPSIFLSEIDDDAIRIIGRMPYSFKHKKVMSTAGLSPQTDVWDVGQRVFNEYHGYGTVREVRNHAEGPILLVRFDSGKELSFLSRHQNSKLTKIIR